MSHRIDDEVVEMRFENRQFEAGVKESLSTLDKLKRALKLDGVSKGFEDVSKAAKNADMKPLERSIAGVTEALSAAEIASIRFISNLVDDAYRAGKSLVKSLSIDQITAGWDKYNSKIQNVQTIMNATGADLDTVNGYLEKLMWFSDETSYSFSDMTTAMSTMVAKGADIDKVIPMIWGIAEATAYAGKTGFDFQRTINNLVQSYSGGYLQLNDWKSLQLAGTNSSALTKTLIRAGVELGKINEGAVTLENFTESLKDKWADSEVMERAFAGWSSMMLDAYDLVNSGEFELASDAIEALSGNYEDYVEKATQASQASKSFSESIEATKDAVSTKWMRSFEIIIGDFEQSKEFFTDFTEYLYDIFAESGNARNRLLKAWSEYNPYAEHVTPRQMKSLVDFGFDEEAITGRDTVINSIWNVLNAIRDTINLVKQSFRDIFPETTVVKLYNFTHGLMTLTENLRMSDETASEFGDIFRGAFAVLDIFIDAIKTVTRGALDLANWMKPAAKGVLSFAAGIGRLTVKFRDAVKESKLFQTVLSSAKQILEPIGNGIKIVTNAILDFIQTLTGVDLRNFGEWADQTTFDLTPVVDIFKSIGNGIRAFGEELKKAKPLVDSVKETLSGVFTTIRNWVHDFFTNSGINVNSILENGLLAGIIYMLNKMYTLLSQIKKASVLQSIKGLFDGLAGYVANLNKQLKAGNVLKTAIAMLALAYAMTMLADIPKDKLLGAMSAMVVIGYVLDMLMQSVNKLISEPKLNVNVKVVIGRMAWIAMIGLALLRCAKAVAVLADVPEDRLDDAVTSLMKLMGVLAGVIGVVQFLASEGSFNAGIGSKVAANGKYKGGQPKGMVGVILAIAGVIVAIAWAVKIMAKASETGNLNDAANKLVKIMITLGGLVAVIAYASKWLQTTEKMAASATSISNPVQSMKLTGKKKGIVGTLLAIAVVITAMGVVAAAISNVPNLDKGVRAITHFIGFTAVVAAALTAIQVLATNKLSGKDAFDLQSLMLGVAAMVASFGLVLALIAKLEEEDVDRALGQMLKLGAVVSAMMLVATLIAWFASVKVKGGLENFANGMLKLSASFALVGVGLMLFTAALLGIVAASGVIIAGIGLIATALGLLVLAIARIIIEAAPVIGEAIVAVKMAMIMGWIKALSDLGQEMVDGVLKIAYMALEAIVDNAGPLIDLVMRAIVVIFKGVAKRAPELIESFNEMLAPFVQSFTGTFSAALTAGGIEGVVLIFKAIFATLNSMKGNAVTAVGVAVAITAVVGLIGGIFYLLRDVDPGRALKQVGVIAALLFAVTAIIGVMSFINGATSAAVSAAVAIVEFLGIILGAGGIVALIVGGLESWGTADNIIQRGFDTINLIVENLGGFIGRFIGGFVGGYNAGKFNQMAKSIGSMGSSIVDMVKTFGGEDTALAANTMGTVFDALKKMVEYSVTDTVSAWMGLGKAPQDMLGDMKALGESLAGFQKATADVDAEKIKPAAEALSELLIALDAIPATGGIWQKLVGETDLSKFGSGLGELAEGLVEFQNKSAGLDESVLKPATAAASVITEFTKQVPNTDGGLIGWIAGSTDIKEFGERLGPLGEGLVDFSKAVTENGGIDAAAVSRAGYALNTVTTAASKIPATNGIGNNLVNIEQFGKYLVGYARQMVTFTEIYDGVVASTFDLAVKHMTSLGDLAKDLSGDTTVSSESIYNLMLIFEAMKDLVNSFAGLAGAEGMDDPETAENTAATMKAIGNGLWDFDHAIRKDGGISPILDMAAFGILQSMAGSIKMLSEIKKPNDLLSAITVYGTTLSDFDANISDVDLEHAQAAMNMIGEIANTAAQINAKEDAVYNLSMVSGELTAMLNNFAGAKGIQIETIPQSMANVVSNMITSFVNKVDETAPLFAIASKSIVTNIASVLTSGDSIRKVYDAGTKLTVAVANGIASKSDALVRSGKNIVQGLIDGINDSKMNDRLKQASSRLASTVEDTFNNKMVIRSPSRVMYQSGSYIGQGLVNALIDSTYGIQNASTAMAVQVVSAVDTAVAQAYDILDGAGDFSPTIRPVIDSSYAKAGAGSISRMFENSGLSFNFESFNRNARAIARLESDKKRRVAVAAKQPEVVNAIQAIADRVDALDEDILNMQLVLDSGATVGGIYRKMDARLGKAVRDKKRRSR